MSIEAAFAEAVDAPTESIEALLRSGVMESRLGAAWVLCARANQRSVLPSAGQRRLALSALVVARQARGLEVLAESDPAPQVRAGAILNLARLVGPGLGPIEMIARISTADEDEAVRAAAVEFLSAQHGSWQHTALVDTWRSDPSETVRHAAVNALLARGTVDASLLEWLEGGGPALVEYGLRRIIETACPLRWEDIPEAMQTSDIATRTLLARALGTERQTPLDFWLRCAQECAWLYDHDEGALELVATVLHRHARSRATMAPADAELAACAREVVARVLPRIAAGNEYMKLRRLKLHEDPRPQLMQHDLPFLQGICNLWVSLASLDPSFDPAKHALKPTFR